MTSQYLLILLVYLRELVPELNHFDLFKPPAFSLKERNDDEYNKTKHLLFLIIHYGNDNAYLSALSNTLATSLMDILIGAGIS